MGLLFSYSKHKIIPPEINERQTMKKVIWINKDTHYPVMHGGYEFQPGRNELHPITDEIVRKKTRNVGHDELTREGTVEITTSVVETVREIAVQDDAPETPQAPVAEAGDQVINASKNAIDLATELEIDINNIDVGDAKITVQHVRDYAALVNAGK